LAKYCGCRAADLSGITTSLVTQKAKSPVVCLNPTTVTITPASNPVTAGP
jgi:hypothetical protein